jgi:hypothetical protein
VAAELQLPLLVAAACNQTESLSSSGNWSASTNAILASQAFDGNSSTTWSSAPEDSFQPQWLQLSFPAPMLLSQYAMLPGKGGAGTWVLQGLPPVDPETLSPGKDWFNLHSVMGTGGGRASTNFSFVVDFGEHLGPLQAVRWFFYQQSQEAEGGGVVSLAEAELGGCILISTSTWTHEILKHSIVAAFMATTSLGNLDEYSSSYHIFKQWPMAASA